MPHHGMRRIDTFPTRNPGPHPKFSIVTIGEEVFIKAADAVEHGFAVHGGAPVGPQDFFHAVELASIHCPRAAPTILTIRINEMAGLIDPAWILIDQNFRSGHPHRRLFHKNSLQSGEPVRIGLGVVIEQRDEVAARGRYALIVGGAEPSIPGIADEAHFGEIGPDDFDGAIGRSVIDDNHFIRGARLATDAGEACA